MAVNGGAAGVIFEFGRPALAVGPPDVDQNPHAHPDWRKNKLQWDADYRHKLQHEIMTYIPEHSNAKSARILLLGPIGSGKSSFFNTVSSIMKGRITQRAPMGSAEHSLTVKYKVYDFRKPPQEGAGNRYARFQLCDTMGMEEKDGVHPDDVSKILDGNIPDGYQFNPTAGMAEDVHGYKKMPALSDKIHCVALVVDGTVADVLQRAMLDKLQQMRNLAFKKRLPVVALVTKVDLVCPECMADLTGVFRCQRIKELVEKLASKLGLPQNNVIPVKSYESENDLETQVDILSLNALRQMLNYCDDFLGEHIQRPPAVRVDNNSPIL